MKPHIILALTVSLTSSFMHACSEQDTSAITASKMPLQKINPKDSNNNPAQDPELLEDNEDDAEYEEQFDSMLCLNASCLSIYIPTFDKSK